MKKWKIAYKVMASRMDDRDRAIDIARRFDAEHGFIPERLEHLRDHLHDTPWRHQPLAVLKLIKAARLAARNQRRAERKMKRAIDGRK